MSQYVTGLLVRNEHGAAAPGSPNPVDRWLVIQTPSGIVIRVFDDTHIPVKNLLLSEQEGITVGHAYSFLLIALANVVENSATATHPLQGQDIWQGTVVQTLWRLPQQHYLAVDPEDIENYQGILLETTIGQLIIPHRLLGDENDPPKLRQGDVLHWEHIRFHLLAILKPES